MWLRIRQQPDTPRTLLAAALVILIICGNELRNSRKIGQHSETVAAFVILIIHDDALLVPPEIRQLCDILGRPRLIPLGAIIISIIYDDALLVPLEIRQQCKIPHRLL
jgi:hypothetical protein